MDNLFEKIEESSESSGDESSSDSDENSNLSEAFPNHFLNMTKKEDYLVNRNKLFTPDLLTKYLVINKTTASNENQFTINFDSDLGINPMKNVIGFKLRKAFSKYSNGPYLTFDVIIDEIPNEACKVSNIDSDTHIIDRIPVSGSSNTLFHYQPTHSLDNYFLNIMEAIQNIQIGKYFSKQNLIISGVVMAILSLMGYKLYDKGYLDDLLKNDNNNGKIIDKKEYEDNKPRVTSQDLDRHIQNEFRNIFKVFQKESQLSAKKMAEFNRDFLLKSEYLNYRNKLFTKDIEKQRIIINLNTTADTPTLYNFDTNLTIDKIDNVIGFNLIRAGILPHATGLISFDLIINEIPHKASKVKNILNDIQDNIIDSIPVNNGSTNINHYIPSEIQENYFFPVSLDKLTITLKSWNGSTYNTATSSNAVKGYLEFEIVTIKNTEHFNKPNK
jgi:hypothetical protein